MTANNPTPDHRTSTTAATAGSDPTQRTDRTMAGTVIGGIISGLARAAVDWVIEEVRS